MNLKPVLVLALLVVFCSLAAFIKPGSVRNTTETRADSAVIYIYRVGQWAGSTANWAMFVDEKKICKLSNNKYIRVAVTPGKHTISSKQGGIAIMKKETEVEIEAEAGGEYFVACNWKTSFTRARLEMIEVTKGTGKKQMEKMSLDNCQEEIDK